MQGEIQTDNDGLELETDRTRNIRRHSISRLVWEREKRADFKFSLRDPEIRSVSARLLSPQMTRDYRPIRTLAPDSLNRDRASHFS